MRRGKHIPERTCVACGRRAPQSELLRIRIDSGMHLRVVRAGGLPGRSAYLHRDDICLRKFANGKGTLRSLKRTVDRGEREAFLARMVECSWDSVPEVNLA